MNRRLQILVCVPVFFVFSGGIVNAQTPTPTYFNFTSLTTTGVTQNTSPFYPNPTGSGSGARAQYLLSPGQFGSIPNGFAINKIYFWVIPTAPNATVTYGSLYIGMAQPSPSYSAFPTTNMSWYPVTWVYDKVNTTIGPINQNSWFSIDLETPFSYDPSLPLIVDVGHLDHVGAGSTIIWTGNGSVSVSGTPAAGNYRQTIDIPTSGVRSVPPTSAIPLQTCFGFDLVVASNSTLPLPGFAFTFGIDTLWAGSPSRIVNTSSFADKSYWNITGYNGNGPSNYAPYTGIDQDQCNTWGCFMDTNLNNPHLNYTFPQRGYYLIRLTTVNANGSTSIEKPVFVDTPARKPTASFFLTKRTLGVNDRTQLNNLSKNAPARNKWFLINECQSCSPGSNEFLPNDSAYNPSILALSPGIYKVCLAVSNGKGADTLCRDGYINIKPGYMMCHSEINSFDSVSKDPEGYLYSNIRDNTNQTSLAGSYIPTSCNGLLGFRIAPCADSITVYLERLRLRTGDSLFIRSVTFNGPILRRFGGSGNTINILNDTVKTLRYPGQQLFVTYVPAVPSTTPIIDSGFALRWTSTAASYAKPKAAFLCADTLYSGYEVKLINASTGNNLDYGWDLNGDGNFGGDNKSVPADSVTQNPTMIYQATSPRTIRICLRTANCKGTDTVCKMVTLMPTLNAPSADFTVTPSKGFILDTFMFVDVSRNGPQKWQWKFDPNNVTYLSGTDSSSQFPLVYLNAAQCYNVTVAATNPYGTDEITKNQIVCAIDYGSPGSGFTPSSSAYDFGIRRVRIVGADGTVADTLTLPKPIPTGGNNGSYTRNFQTKGVTVYRGGIYHADVYRATAVDPVNTRIWIDYNRDADYEDENETVYEGNSELLIKTSVDFMVPANTVIGQSRMLVGMSWYKSLITPTTATLGVYEDFGVKVEMDLVKPVVKLKGKAVVRAELNKPYIDSGATATDNIQSNISDSVKMIGSVDVDHYGYYFLKYYVMDYYGNVSDTVIRTVQIEVNQSGPEVELMGQDTVFMEVYGTYVEPGYKAVDHLGKDITDKVVVTHTLNTSVLGYYMVTYTVTDEFGFPAHVTRVVKVEDTTSPVIVIKEGKWKVSDDTIRHQIFTAFDDNSYLQVKDNYWDDVLPVRSGSINTDIRGIYTLTYNAIDGSGNIAATKTIYVKVTNLVKPTIVLRGGSEMTVPVFVTFDDPGATGYDFRNKPIDPIRELNDLDINRVGNYTITYNIYDDGFGNSAQEKRRILVRDQDPPEIALNGDNPFNIAYGTEFKDIDPWVKASDNYEDPQKIQITADYSDINKFVSRMYVVTYIAKDSSGNTSAILKRYVAVGMSGIEDLIHNELFMLYPNPASNLLNIEMKKSDHLTGFKIFDIRGRLKEDMQLKKTSNGNYTIEVSPLSPGLYLLKVQTEDGKNSSAKFIINK